MLSFRPSEFSDKTTSYPYVYVELVPEWDMERDGLVTVMDIRLIYKGPLLATGNDALKPAAPNRAREIHLIRRRIHEQLAVLWEKHPILKAKRLTPFIWLSDLRRKIAIDIDLDLVDDRLLETLGAKGETKESIQRLTEVEALGKRFNRCGFNFVPLVNADFNCVCALDILFLRREDPGHLITTLGGGDIDNRIKTLLDALQIPQSCTQVDGTPGPDETPFYTLLQDDGLVTDLKVTTDRLLQPLKHGEEQNNVVLIIQAHIKTSQAWFDSEESEECDTNVLGS